MKWLFYSLALTNAAVLALQYWYLPPVAEPTVQYPTDPGNFPHRLVMISEAQQTPDPRDPDAHPAVLATTGPASPALTCYQVAATVAADDAEAVLAKLRAAGATVRARHVEPAQDTRYWVLLPPAAAVNYKAVIARLEAAGITDHYVIKSGPNKHAMSLGVFSRPEGAARRRQQAEQAGLHPTINHISADKSHYVWTVALAGTKTPPHMQLGNDTQVAKTRCP